MRHVVVTRLVLALCLGFAAAALGFAVTARRLAPPAVPGPADGAALFAAHCGACHAAADLAAPRGDLSLPERARTLTAFLATHGDAPDAADRAIVAWLVGGADTAAPSLEER